MRLYGSKVPALAQEIVRTLLASKDIELEEASGQREVTLDVEAVLRSYLETERLVDDKTKELLQRTGRGHGEFSRVRQQIAEHHGIRVGDEALDYLLDQVVAMLMHSSHVDEVFAEDVELRRHMAPVFKRFMAIDVDIDTEVRGQLKHVTEGTPQWDIEYRRVLEATKRKRGVQ